MGELLVSIILIVWMVRCLVNERLAIQAFEACDHEARCRVIKNDVSEDFEKFISESLLVVFGL